MTGDRESTTDQGQCNSFIFRDDDWRRQFGHLPAEGGETARAFAPPKSIAGLMETKPAEIQIVADDRENAGGVIDALRQMPGTVVEVRRLACGDFLIGERIVVERKTAIDLPASVVDGRVFRQAERMKHGWRRGVLLLEGNETDAQVAGVSREALQGALIHLAVFDGLAILRSRDPAETAHLLVYLGRQAVAWARGALPRAGYRPRGLRARRLFVLQGFPRIGPERAARLLERFGSIQTITNASNAELASVDGIGPAIATGIRAIVGPENRSVSGETEGIRAD